MYYFRAKLIKYKQNCINVDQIYYESLLRDKIICTSLRCTNFNALGILQKFKLIRDHLAVSFI